MALATQPQRAFVQKVFNEPSLIFAAGVDGVSANLVGKFRLVGERDEDRIEVGDGTDHVHVDWSRVKSVEHSLFHGEGLLLFKNDAHVLFKFYRPAGPFNEGIQASCGVFTN